MGLKLISKRVKHGYENTYLCSKCGNVIIPQHFISYDSVWKFGWDLFDKCPKCGEQLTREVKVMQPIIDEYELKRIQMRKGDSGTYAIR